MSLFSALGFDIVWWLVGSSEVNSVAVAGLVQEAWPKPS